MQIYKLSKEGQRIYLSFMPDSPKNELIPGPFEVRRNKSTVEIAVSLTQEGEPNLRLGVGRFSS